MTRWTPSTDLLLNSILPNLKAVQVSQSEQIAANDRLEHSIEHLRAHLDAEFNKLSTRLIAAAQKSPPSMPRSKPSRPAATARPPPKQSKLVH